MASLESGEKMDANPPTPVGFWDPALKELRKQAVFKWVRTVLILCVFILAVLSLYWAVQFTVDDKLNKLKVWVVDFDNAENPLVGPAVTQLATQIGASGQSLGYVIKSPSEFGFDPVSVIQSVYDEHCWAAIIVSADATTLLRDAISNGNSSYAPTDAATTVIIQARDQTTFSSYITPALNSFELQLRASFGPEWVSNLTSSGTNLASVPPQAINPAIGFSTLDLRPFAPAAATPSVTIGLIYLIIIAFFNFPFTMPVHGLFLKGPNPLKIPQWLIWRVCSSIIAYFFLSLFYSFVSLAFQIPFTNDPAPDTVSAANPNAYGRGSFVVFWMLNWVGMAALGFPCENMAMVLGFPYSSLFLIFWVITNVSSGFYALDVAPEFFQWGRAWPLHRIVEALRTILFGTHSRIGLDFGILFAWIAVSLAFFPVASFIMRWKMKRGL
ncbi:SNG1 family protein [Aspergillus stella-maris]|uniref:SNG1 family protein n=1 Tax=Aspergillus stella-maris TaxID=1810926 RepID=UPI003CCD4969